MLLFFTSLIVFPWLEGTAILKGINQVHIKDWFIGEPIPLVHGSLDTCTSHCGIMVESMSMFYNRAAQKCICSNYGYIKRPSALGQSGAGWNYYLILDGKKHLFNFEYKYYVSGKVIVLLIDILVFC